MYLCSLNIQVVRSRSHAEFIEKLRSGLGKYECVCCWFAALQRPPQLSRLITPVPSSWMPLHQSKFTYTQTPLRFTQPERARSLVSKRLWFMFVLFLLPRKSQFYGNKLRGRPSVPNSAPTPKNYFQRNQEKQNRNSLRGLSPFT